MTAVHDGNTLWNHALLSRALWQDFPHLEASEGRVAFVSPPHAFEIHGAVSVSPEQVDLFILRGTS